MSYLFILSYAREDNELDGLVKKFYEDLCKDISGKTAVRPDEVGFFDGSEIEPGAMWDHKQASALQKSSVFIAVYSPYYFQKKLCGKEWAVFSSRVEAYAKSLPKGSDFPALIFPVLWQKEDYVLPRIPTGLGKIQYKHDAFGNAYAEQGLRVMLRNKKFKQQYDDFISALGDKVIEAMERHKLPALSNLSPLEEIIPAFPVDDATVIEKADRVLKAPPEGYRTTSNLFFLSYAREDNISDELVRKFYEDLCKDISGKTAARPDEVGFFDAETIETGANWDQQQASALQQSNVFIAVYSPYYFQKKFCGKEWAVFSSRVEAYAKSLPKGSDFPALIFPVLWQKEDYVLPRIPTELGKIQYKYDAYGKAYAEQGLRILLRNRKFREQYYDFISALGDKVIEAVQRHKLPTLPNLPPIEEIIPAFPVDNVPAAPVIEGVDSVLKEPPEGYRTVSNLFFLSYAREDNKLDGLVKKFYEDLCKDISWKTAARPNEVGFFDGSEIEPGYFWDQKTASALQQSSVFIAVYSPYYFANKFCGKEWAVFSSRVEAYAKSLPKDSDFPGLIFPVLWQKEDYVLPRIPTEIGKIKYKHDAFGKAYAEQGLRVMLRNKKFKQQYDDFISVLADEVIEAARRHKPPTLPNLPPIDEIIPAFPVDDAPAAPVIEGPDSVLKAPPEGHRITSNLFYLSYAREDNKLDGLVKKFYEDLCKDISGKTAARPDEVGFFDGSEIEPGAMWDHKQASALQQNSVFIAVYSPYYFQKKLCGKEWAVFSSRVEAYAKSLPKDSDFPALIFPVLWQKEDYVLPRIPTGLGKIQYKYSAYGWAYAEQGLRVMLRNKKFGQQYDDFVYVLGDLVIEAAQRHKLPALSNLPPYEEVIPAFPVDNVPAAPVIEKAESGLSDTQTYDFSSTTQFVPLHDAYERIVNFARRFGEPHVALAMHAALPLGLSPELLHLIRVNFVNRAPMIAEADLLLSPLCREVGGRLYEMYPEVRELLLAELNEDEEIPDSRIEELAEFLMVYATRNLNSARFPELRNFLVAQQWTALACLRPAETAQALASALGKRLSAQNPVGSLRLAQLARSMNAQLNGQDNVLVYAAGVESLAFGDVKRASETFGILGSMSQSPAVKSITLPAPADLAQLWPESAKGLWAEGLWAEGLWAESRTGPPPLPAHVTLRGKISEGGTTTTQVAWSPDGGLIIGASTEGALRVWDVKTGRELMSFDGIPREVNDIAWSPDRRFIAASFDNEVAIWEQEIGVLKSRLTAHRESVKSVAWSPDGNRLASASYDGTVNLWDVITGQKLNTFEYDNPRYVSKVNSVAWAPAGAYYLVAGYVNGDVIAWDTDTGEMRRTYRGHKAAVNSVAISPNRAVFASGSDDGAIRIWRIDEPANNFQIMLEGHTKEVTKICFSPNGGLLASRSNDGTVRIWRASDWRCVAIINVSTSFAGTNAYFPALAFHPSEPLLATCVDRPDEISILELDEKALINAAFNM